MNKNLIPANVAALDHMLMAIGGWQANPTMQTWQRKLATIRTYLAAAQGWDFPNSAMPR